MGPCRFRARLTCSNSCQGRLPQGKFNNHIVLSSMNIVLQLSELRLSPPPPEREGLRYCLMWSVLGCAAGQDLVFGLCPQTWYIILCTSSPDRCGLHDQCPILFFFPKQGQGVKPATSPNTQTLVKSAPPPPHRSRKVLIKPLTMKLGTFVARH